MASAIAQAIIAKALNAHKSWTVWFNALMTAAGLVSTYVPIIQAVAPPNIMPILLGLTTAGNFLLRFKTNTPLENK